MPPKPKVDSKKSEAERLTGFLQGMLKEEENKYCADCESKQPRWASWNLGVFLCIRCAGLHRNLGVHISKVKSVNLDSWTAEQVQSMRVMGNAKAKAVYEHDLPQLFRRPQTDQALEAFIRAKYESKRYIIRDWAPPRVNAEDLPAHPSLDAPKKAGSSVNEKQQSVKVNPLNSSHSPKGAAQPNLINDSPSHSNVLIDIFSSPTHQPSPVVNGSNQGEASAAVQHSGSSLDDLFGPIVSAPNPVNSLQTSHSSGQIPSPPHDDPFCQISGSTSAEADLFAFGGMGAGSGATIANTSPPAANASAVNSLTAELEDVHFEGSGKAADDDSKKSNVDILALFGKGQSGGGGGLAGFAPANPLQSQPSMPPSMFHFGGSSQHQQPPALFQANVPAAAPTTTAKTAATSSGLDDLMFGQFKL